MAFQDAFDGTTTTLTLHDANWINMLTGGSAAIDGSGRCQSVTSPALYRYATLGLTDQVCKVTVEGADQAGGPMVRCAGTAAGNNETGYFAYIVAGGTVVRVYKRAPGGNTQLGSDSAAQTAFADGDTLEIRASGSGTVTLTAHKNGAAAIVSTSDASSPYNTGDPGMYLGDSALLIRTFDADALSANVTLTPPAGAIAVTGVAPALKLFFQIAPPAGAVTLAGVAPTLSIGTGVIAPPVGAITLTGQAPTVNISVGNTVSLPPAGAITLAGVAPAILTTVLLSPPAGAITLTGTNVQIAFGGPDAGTITLIGLVPAVVITVFGNPTIAVPAGSITLTGLAPTISSETLVGLGGSRADLTTALSAWMLQTGKYNNEEILRRLKALYGGSDVTTLLAKFLRDRS